EAPPREVADVEGQPPFPDDAAWDAEKEVLFAGSDAMGCKTKVKDSWFRASCAGKATFVAVEVEAGRRPTQTTAEIADGKLSIVTPYVEETDFVAHLTLDGAGERWMRVRWPKGKRPLQVGSVSETR
ncbi:MAG TPA: hypothetical protein VL400_24770, partial [Polyangiaceae bacterium]|nr:hypothetical protein [Polyangiaceae bacterium]